jgi:hypothetical protein
VVSVIVSAGESRFIDAPVGTKFRPIYSFQEGDHMVTDPMVSDDLMLKLLRTSVSMYVVVRLQLRVMRYSWHPLGQHL